MAPIVTPHLKPLAVYSLDCLIRVYDNHGRPAITSDIVTLLQGYNRRHEHNNISKRLSELHEAGMIRPTGGKRKSALTKKQQSEWVPTAAGRAFLADRLARTGAS